MTIKPCEFPLEMVKLVLCDLPLYDDDFMLNFLHTNANKSCRVLNHIFVFM